ncbi:hypothetical protein PROFUN_05187 [Planoprotostelium fungivorum]|uniref:Ribosomal protein eL8/eL30/eS12/Gadd45 domain-containing protein n=1 Tax=Planoprotostelium fungivorum TaxID=1890364 RepID=A0A2P6NRF9_9EUKA|nr:hypothetical protein PROFUN_05187 [Planoprotostelium fungivorum]
MAKRKAESSDESSSSEEETKKVVETPAKKAKAAETPSKKKQESSSDDSSSEDEKSKKSKTPSKAQPTPSKKGKTEESKKSSKDVEPSTEYVSPLATPMANDALQKKILKALASGEYKANDGEQKITRKPAEKTVGRGVKEVSKRLRKDQKGIVVLAGNAYPVDVISHLPILCEDKSIPYIWLPRKEVLGSAGLKTANRSACAMFINQNEDTKDLAKEIQKLHK